MAPSIEKRGRNSYSSDEEAALPLYNMNQDESTLPLYAAGSSSAARPVPALPDKKSTPQEIRDFLVQLLVATRSLPVPEAQAIASAWKIGTGQELHSYPPQMYRQLWGSENGWVVCKEVKMLIIEEKWKTQMGKRGMVLLLALFISIFSAAVAIANTANNEVLIGVSVFLAGISALASGGIFIPICIPTPTTESCVDSELNSSFFKNSGEQVGTSS